MQCQWKTTGKQQSYRAVDANGKWYLLSVFPRKISPNGDRSSEIRAVCWEEENRKSRKEIPFQYYLI
jgi:hypothetical protein